MRSHLIVACLGTSAFLLTMGLSVADGGRPQNGSDKKVLIELFTSEG
jgi:hypothetical protein